MQTEARDTRDSSGEGLVTADRLAHLLETSPRSVYRMAERGQIPHYRVGGRGVRFNVREVLAALRRFPRGTDE